MGRCIGLLCFLCAVAIALGQTYSDKYDKIDIDKILSSKRILNNYIKCILDEGPCTAEGREIKQHIPEAVTTNCEKCTAAQKRIVRKASTFIMRNQPQQWERIRSKFDPQGKFKESFAKFLNES